MEHKRRPGSSEQPTASVTARYVVLTKFHRSCIRSSQWRYGKSIAK
jgi:hypothetical protein